MEKKVSFRNMDHSEALEAHALKKLAKLEEFCSDTAMPLRVEILLEANSSRQDYKTDFVVRIDSEVFNTSSESRDLYVAMDEATDKMITKLKKAKELLRDKKRSMETDKRNFGR